MNNDKGRYISIQEALRWTHWLKDNPDILKLSKDAEWLYQEFKSQTSKDLLCMTTTMATTACTIPSGLPSQ